MRAALLLAAGSAAGAATGASGPAPWLLLFALVVGSAFFSGCETGVVSARRARLEHLAIEGRRDARTALALLKDVPATIAGILVGTNLCNIGAASLATAVAVRFSPENGPVLATVFLTPVALFAAEILPKALYRSRPTVLLLASAGALRVLGALLRPAVALTSATTRGLLFVLRVPAAGRRPVFERQDLENLFLYGAVPDEAAEEDGTRETLRMAGRVLELVRRRVTEAMVPLPEERTCALAGNVGEAVERFRASGGRILAAVDTRGRVAGFVSAKEVLGVSPGDPLTPHVRPAYPLRPEDTLDQAITGLRRSRLSVAVVRDASGVTLGVVTPEDLLEEVVGEIRPVRGGLRSGGEP